MQTNNILRQSYNLKHTKNNKAQTFTSRKNLSEIDAESATKMGIDALACFAVFGLIHRKVIERTPMKILLFGTLSLLFGAIHNFKIVKTPSHYIIKR